jgi:hypothetical protein
MEPNQKRGPSYISLHFSVLQQMLEETMPDRQELFQSSLAYQGRAGLELRSMAPSKSFLLSTKLNCKTTEHIEPSLLPGDQITGQN